MAVDKLTTEAVDSSHALLSVVISVRGDGQSYSRLIESLSALPTASWRLVRVPIDPAEGFALAVSTALKSVDTEYVFIAHQDGALAPSVVDALRSVAPADVVYFDEENILGGVVESHLKPDYSPERLRCQFYFGNAVFYRTEHFRSIGGLRTGFAGAELYELALRATRHAVVVHIPISAFTSREPRKPWAIDASGLAATRRALVEHLGVTGGGRVESVSESGTHVTRRAVHGDPLVSIIIPSRGSIGSVQGRSARLIDECVSSIVARSTYRNFEIVVVLDTVAGPEVQEELSAIDSNLVRVVWWDRPFTFSGKMNRGVFASQGEFLLFLNDDTVVITPDWIEAMLALCQLPEAGMSGAMLYFEDDSIQHGGHLYRNGGPGHIGFGRSRSDSGPEDGYRVERETSGVTAACSMMPRALFDEVGGFSPLLPGNFNDVDLCMKVRSRNRAIYWTPHAELYHFESKSRFTRIADYELSTLRARWWSKLIVDPYWAAENAIMAQAALLGSQS